jgi:transposase
MVTIGIDPHKASHTAVALDSSGEMLGELRVVADASMLRRLWRWASSWPQRVWAIEGAAGLGRLLAQQLVAAGERVVDVPSALAARARVLARGHGRKTDGIDARSVAVVAQHRSDLLTVAADDHTAVLRLLSDRRDELTGERRRTVNRLHRVLRDLRPGGAPRQLSADRATRLLTAIRPASAVDLERKAIARQLIADVRRLDRALLEPPSLRAGRRVVGQHPRRHLRHQRRPRSQDPRPHRRHHPLRQRRPLRQLHRHRAGRSVKRRADPPPPLARRQRSLNHALHMAARVQTMHPGPGRSHYQRKRAEHKTPTEALRSLKRQLAKVVYRQLRNDHTSQPLTQLGLT